MSLDFCSQVPAAAFGWTWRTSLHASVLIALVLLIVVIFRKWLSPAWCYGLWLLVVFRLLLPVAPPSPLSIFNLTKLGPPTLSSVKSQREFKPMQFPAEPNVPQVSFETPVDKFATALSSGEDSNSPSDSNRRATVPVAAAAIQRLRLNLLTRPPNDVLRAGRPRAGSWIDARRIASWLWLAGAGSYLLLIVRQHRKISSQTQRGQRIADERVRSILASVQAMLGVRRQIEIIETNDLSTPAVFGVLRPRLLLPVSVHQTLDDHELRLIFLHELTHIKRGDIFLNWLLILLQAVHWFNPLVWLAFRRLRAERELVRDAQVLRRLDSEERQCYGETLIKLAEQFSPTGLSPSLAPVLNHPTEIKRRITMIAQFKPTPRSITMASAVLVITLACFTFTRAAEKQTAPPTAEKNKSVPAPDTRMVAHEQLLAVLANEYGTINEKVRQKQSEVNRLREELKISDPDPTSNSTVPVELESLRKLETQSIEAHARYEGINTLYTNLAGLPRLEFRKAVQTAAPDPQLGSLMEKRTEAEIRLTDLTVKFSDQHPDVMQVRNVIKILEKEIEDRLDGILAGLKARIEAQKAEVDALRHVTGKLAREAETYWSAKRELIMLKEIRNYLNLRITQEKIDAAIKRDK